MTLSCDQATSALQDKNIIICLEVAKQHGALGDQLTYFLGGSTEEPPDLLNIIDKDECLNATVMVVTLCSSTILVGILQQEIRQ